MNDQLNRLMASIDVGVIFINRLSELGQQVGSRVLDVLVLREKGMKREVRVLNILLFVKSVLWKVRPFSYYLDNFVFSDSMPISIKH